MCFKLSHYLQKNNDLIKKKTQFNKNIIISNIRYFTYILHNIRTIIKLYNLHLKYSV